VTVARILPDDSVRLLRDGAVDEDTGRSLDGVIAGEDRRIGRVEKGNVDGGEELRVEMMKKSACICRKPGRAEKVEAVMLEPLGESGEKLDGEVLSLGRGDGVDLLSKPKKIGGVEQGVREESEAVWCEGWLKAREPAAESVERRLEEATASSRPDRMMRETRAGEANASGFFEEGVELMLVVRRKEEAKDEAGEGGDSNVRRVERWQLSSWRDR
jgi:hypothetical protein